MRGRIRKERMYQRQD